MEHEKSKKKCDCVRSRTMTANAVTNMCALLALLLWLPTQSQPAHFHRTFLYDCRRSHTSYEMYGKKWRLPKQSLYLLRASYGTSDCERSHPFLRNVRILTATANAVTHFHTNSVQDWRLPTQSHLNTKNTPKRPDCIMFVCNVENLCLFRYYLW